MDNTSGALRGNSIDDMGIVFSIQVTEDTVITFSHANIKNFIMYNQMNTAPSGSFELMDTGILKDYGLVSGMYGNLIFTGTSDNDESKVSGINIYISECKSIGESQVNDLYTVKWIAGNPEQSIHIDIVAEGKNSIEAMKYVMDQYNTPYLNKLEDDDTTDAMNWLLVKENMWGKLDTIINRSYKKNDYMFWTLDDVNSNINISSLSREKSEEIRYIFYPSESGFNTSKGGRIVENGITHYPYMKFSKSNYLGKLSSAIYPNISFIGFPRDNGEDYGVADIRQEKFIDFLLGIGDDKIQEIIEHKNVAKVNASYGEFNIKYHNKNGHRMYSISDTYRRYKISTYSKGLNITLFNQMGPPIGSKCGSIVYKSGRSSKGLNEVDERFTDEYIVVGKIIEYEGQKTTYSGNSMTGPTPFKVTLILSSDNYMEKGKEVKTDLSENA
jgi:hypothetical protein